MSNTYWYISNLINTRFDPLHLGTQNMEGRKASVEANACQEYAIKQNKEINKPTHAGEISYKEALGRRRPNGRDAMETETQQLPERVKSSQLREAGRWTMGELVLNGLLELHAPTFILYFTGVICSVCGILLFLKQMHWALWTTEK